jgi:hypothetical protein
MLTIQQYAARVAGTARKMRAGADVFHAAYISGTPEQREDLRRRWMLGHLTGQGCKGPERILSRGKGAGADAEHIKAIDRASADFRYMVVRPDVVAAPKASARISREHRAAAKAYLAQFDSLAAAIAALKAVA